VGVLEQNAGVTIAEVDLADERTFHGWYEAIREIWLDAWPGDPPWADEAVLRELLMDRADGDRALFIGYTSSGVVAAAAQVDLPTRDNLHLASLELGVRPQCRGLGIGRALLEQAEAFAAANGRTVLLGSTFGRRATLDSRDARFARAAGFSHARTEVRRELALPLGGARFEELDRASRAASTDYEPVSWWQRCPDELVESRARLAWTLTADEPHGDLDVEAEQFDVERVRRWERDVEKTGRVLACAGAVSKETGELAAVTELGLPRPGEDLAFQFATVVDREHRGHRLGILVKLANLKMIAGHPRAPERVITWNAESNEHMIRVNEELGFEVTGRAFNFQKTTSQEG
jgi:GNAT superfamily N-acetyltransferase